MTEQAGSWLVKLIITVFWPWFRKTLWPVIQKFIVALLLEVLEFIREWIAEWLRSRKEREQRAREQAEEAERQAQGATGHAEKAEWQAKAQVWRIVAEEMRQENEQLQEQLERVMQEASARAEARVKYVTPEIITSGGQTMIKVDQEQVPLLTGKQTAAQLPLPADEKAPAEKDT